MCRLFASRSTAPIHVDRLLLDSKASLCTLSQEHRHGWGIGQYRAGAPELHRNTLPAYEDPEFAKVARAAESDLILAHIRRRSVGEYSVEDNHPFRHGRYLFAHNGTVQRFEQHKSAIEALIDPELLPLLRGSTDSERLFLVFLTRLKSRAAFDAPTLDDLAAALAQTTAAVDKLDPGPGQQHLLTFLVTDGEHLIGIRHGEKELYLSRAEATSGSPAHLFLASEPLSTEDRWELVPDGQILGLGADLAVRRWAIDPLP